MNLFFVYDEYSDVAHEDNVRVMADVSMDALRTHTPLAPKTNGSAAKLHDSKDQQK
jgi:hypothetical protein